MVLLNIQLRLFATVQVSERHHMNKRWMESVEWDLRVSSDLHTDTNVCTGTHKTKSKNISLVASSFCLNCSLSLEESCASLLSLGHTTP